jgi:hypothetical protein
LTKLVKCIPIFFLRLRCLKTYLNFYVKPKVIVRYFSRIRDSHTEQLQSNFRTWMLFSDSLKIALFFGNITYIGTSFFSSLHPPLCAAFIFTAILINHSITHLLVIFFNKNHNIPHLFMVSTQFVTTFVLTQFFLKIVFRQIISVHEFKAVVSLVFIYATSYHLLNPILKKFISSNHTSH